ncbi:MAG: hypothetical protein AMJ88_02085 [Anaerolineae bacterium SM23_ 63]|nr:MAG: hypothetical protein AMJ88_02085 [Anaerolineae bacterium SM23_ 63]
MIYRLLKRRDISSHWKHAGRWFFTASSSHLSFPILLLITITTLLVALILPLSTVEAQTPAGYSEYYIPGGTEQLWNIYVDLDNDPVLQAAQGMHAVIAVTATLDDTKVYYDHWEDTYDFDPADPEVTADQIVTLNQGQVAEFESNNIPVPRGTSTYYDGRDRIYVAGGPVTVTRASWPESIGTVFSLAWEIYPTKPFLTNYTIPVGQDLAGAPYNYDDFDRVYVIVQSTTNGNNVQIDDPTIPGIELSTTLNQGGVDELYSINHGTTVAADDPVQVQFIVGQAQTGNASEVRGFSAVPDSLWDTEYYNPVSGASAGNVDLYLYNPNASTISINYQDAGSSGSFTVDPGITRSYSDGTGHLVPLNSGAYLQSANAFWGIGSGDTESPNYDWGFSLVPAWALEDHYFLGWAPGTSEAVPGSNGSPVYITPLQDETTVYIDYSPTDGTPNVTYTLNRLQSQKVFDPDNENTGMHIWATGIIAVAWGEDPDTASTGTPYLDLGYSTLPLPEDWMDVVLGIDKTADPTSLPPGPGQVSTFTIVVSTFNFPVSAVDVIDTLPPGWDYVSGSTTITLPDSTVISGAAADPIVSLPDLTWDLDQDMGINETLTIVFDGVTTAAVSSGYNQNDSQAIGTRLGGAQVFTPIDSAFVYISALTIDKDTSTPAVEPGGVATYTIRIVNGTDGTITNVTVTDDLPPDFSYDSGSITEVNATRTGITDPGFGDTSLAWGTWDINASGSVTITFDVNVDAGATPGTYDNTASADSTQTGLIDDNGILAQDPDTPPDEDPEDDEDVTITDIPSSILVTKTANPTSLPEPGGNVDFTVRVDNTSAVDTVTISSLIDDIHGDLNGQGNCTVPQVIAVGGFYECTFTASVNGSPGYIETDTVTASGTDDDGVPVSDDDDATVTITDVPSSILVTKTANPTSLPEPGGNVDFTVRVDNTSAVDTVTISSLIDDIHGDLNGQGNCTVPQVIAVGGFYECTFTASVNGSPGYIETDTVTASGTDDDGVPLSDDDDATVTITDVASSILVTKTANPTSLPAPGGTVNFTVRIDNISAVDTVTISSLIDDIHGDLNGQGNCTVPQVIAVGGFYECTFSASVTGVAGDTETDTATASGTDDDGVSVSDDDYATVTIVDVSKSLVDTNQTFTTSPDVAIGEILTYEISVVVEPGTMASMTLTDVLDRGLVFVTCGSITPSPPTLTTTRGDFVTVCNTPTVSTEPTGSSNPADQGRRVEFDFGDVGNPTASAGTLTVRYLAVVLNNIENQRGISLTNDVDWQWIGGALSSSASPVTIVEPELILVKSASPTVALPGTTITFTLNLNHDTPSDTNAYDLMLQDQVPSGLTYVPGSLAWTGVGLSPTALDDSAAPTLSIMWDSFPLGGSSEIQYQAILGSLPPGSTVTNTAFLQWTSLPGDVSTAQSIWNSLSTERDYDPGDPVNVYGLGASASIRIPRLPDTGFAPGRETPLASPPMTPIYQNMGGMWLDIPALNVFVPIVGVPMGDDEWDLTWLWGQAGYLEGTAFPTWSGNTALTAHVYLPSGEPGPFVRLADLRWGKIVVLHAYTRQYIYEVRQVRYVHPRDLSVLQHEGYDWLTLITCAGYDQVNDQYLRRVIVRAVLVEIR